MKVNQNNPSLDWTKEGVKSVLGARLGEELQSMLDTALPLLYRSILRLGSFPYLDRPTIVLTQTHVRAALGFLYQRHLQLARPIGAAHSTF